MTSLISKRKRVSQTIVVCPVIYGSIAFYLGKKADQMATHRWTLFVRGPNDEDLSVFIQKVAFTLHPSFAEPIREISKPPFEVTETGWGEFEAGIRIFFKDPEEQPVDFFQHIKLYPVGIQQSLNAKKPVMSESYDEIVFCEPTEKFHSLLMMYSPESAEQKPLVTTVSPPAATKVKVPIVATTYSDYYTTFDDALDLETLQGIHEHLLSEVENAKGQLLALESSSVDSQHRSFVQQQQQQQLLQQQQQLQQQTLPVLNGVK